MLSKVGVLVDGAGRPVLSGWAVGCIVDGVRAGATSRAGVFRADGGGRFADGGGRFGGGRGVGIGKNTLMGRGRGGSS